ncbi:MAG TPA: hypothetical protein VNQ52_11495 [Microbacteriaceae bacterium]|nr:hypothetical protein [Microbacteriaceae bacterium]
MERVVDQTLRPIFSLWTWALLTPFLVTAYGGFDEARGPVEQWLGLGIAILTHLALGLAFIGAAALERRISSYPMWVAFVAAVLVVMSLLRPAMTTGLQVLVGVPPVTTDWWLRFLMNYVLLSGAVIVVGLWLRSSDRSAQSRDRLRRVLKGRTDDIRAAELATDRVVEEFTESIAAPVLAALEGARVRPFDAAAQAERLRIVAHEVVRPLSHHVFDAATPVDIRLDAPTIAIERVTRRRPALLPERVVPAPAWLPVLIFLIVVAPIVLHVYALPAGALRLLAAGACGIALTFLVALVPVRRRWAAITLYTLAYLGIGIVLAWSILGQSSLWLPAPVTAAPLAFWFYLPLGYAMIAVVASLGFSLRADARGTERTLARALAFAEAAATESRNRYEETANDVARVLHNLVQGDILATSLQLRMGVVGEPAIDELIENVDRTLHEPAATRAIERTAQEVRDAANAAIVSWARVMDITSEATDAECWLWLAKHPAATALFLDAKAEALTNAARHAAAPTADLRLERIDGGVRMLARNPGRLGSGASDGVGVSDLRRRGAQVELRQEDPGTVLLTIDIVDPDEQETERLGEAVPA